MWLLWTKEKKSFVSTYDNSPIKTMCNEEVWRFSCTKQYCSNAKKGRRKTKKSAAHANLILLIRIRSIDLSVFLFISIVNQASLLALAKSVTCIIKDLMLNYIFLSIKLHKGRKFIINTTKRCLFRLIKLKPVQHLFLTLGGKLFLSSYTLHVGAFLSVWICSSSL